MCSLRKRITLTMFVWSVKVRYDGKTCEKEEFVHFENDMELSLSRLLFKAMSEITGIVPKWGVITGIRPVKRVNDMLSEGMNKAEIFKAMESDIFAAKKSAILHTTLL